MHVYRGWTGFSRMTAVTSLKTAVCQKKSQLTAVRQTAINIYRGTLKQNRGESTVDNRGFEEPRCDSDELWGSKTSISCGIVFCVFLVANRDLYIISIAFRILINVVLVCR